jgi:hypothetical protein
MSNEEATKMGLSDDTIGKSGVESQNQQIIQKPLMTNLDWENFSKSDLLNFLIRFNLQKVTVDDGSGRKATVKINSKGEYNVSYTSSEVM